MKPPELFDPARQSGDRDAHNEQSVIPPYPDKKRFGLYILYITFAGSILILLSAKPVEVPLVQEKLPEIDRLLNNKDLQSFGERLFFDTNLSTPEGQSCAACHGPEVGWTGPDETVNKTGGVYPGAVHERYGNRKPNSSAYASLSPVFHSVVEDGNVVFIGGNFWDGRATGEKLGNPAADQAQGPFLNPVEQNIADAKSLVEKVCRSEYSDMFKKVGNDIWKIKDICAVKDVDLSFHTLQKYQILNLVLIAGRNLRLQKI